MTLYTHQLYNALREKYNAFYGSTICLRQRLRLRLVGKGFAHQYKFSLR